MINMNKFAEINMAKNAIVDSILPLLDDLRDDNKKEVNNICRSFLAIENAEIECVKMVLNEICSSNPDILGRVDVFDTRGIGFNIADDRLDLGKIKGITITLFLDKDKSILDHPDIDRFYSQYPKFFTEIFDEEDSNNKFFGALFDSILAVKEKREQFRLIETKSIDGIYSDFIPDVVDKVEREGLKCKAIENMTSNNEEYVYFFIYETEYEEMIKQIEPLERRSSFRLVK